MAGAGLLNIGTLSGTYFQSSDYTHWKFSNSGRVLKLTTAECDVVWKDDAKRYEVIRRES
jgi:hypothetical protein